MKVTKSELLRICPNYPADRIDTDVVVLNAWMEPFGITTALRFSHFISQLAFESNQFRSLEENLNYSADRLLQVFPKYFKDRATAERYARHPEMIANRVYANRMGNGDEASGDGWKYRGRGYIMITGKSGYLAYEQSGFCNGHLTAHPEWLVKSPGRIKSALWFWYKSGCNKLADADDIRTITQRINGGMNGFADRQYYLRRAKRVMFI